MTLPEIIGVATGIAGAIGLIVKITQYVTKLQSQIKIERLEIAKEEADKVQANLEATNKLLLEELYVAKKSGAAISAKKSEIDDELISIMNILSAGGASIYLPLLNLDRKAQGMVFLSIQPITQQTMKLRKKIIPMDSLTGKCFESRRPIVSSNAKKSKDHFDKADELSGYNTEDILTLPIEKSNEVLGVLQLLNKKDGVRFTEKDIDDVKQFSQRLATALLEFTSLPNYMDILGVQPEQPDEYATIMFCDLSSSSSLFRELNISTAIHHINEYLEQVCNVAFKYGATVDKYMGDAVLLRFNVPQKVQNHQFEAIKAAIEINKAFDQLKKDWSIMGDALDRLHTRAGIAYGPVKKVNIGHPQYQYLTVFGPAVNAAVNLCESSSRTRNTIVVDEQLYEQVSGSFTFKKFPESELGKAKNYTKSAYEIV